MQPQPSHVYPSLPLSPFTPLAALEASTFRRICSTIEEQNGALPQRATWWVCATSELSTLDSSTVARAAAVSGEEKTGGWLGVARTLLTELDTRSWLNPRN